MVVLPENGGRGITVPPEKPPPVRQPHCFYLASGAARCGRAVRPKGLRSVGANTGPRKGASGYKAPECSASCRTLPSYQNCCVRRMISDPNRAYFENIGLSRVRRELGWRSPHYLNNNEQRRQASEWVEEELAKLRQDKPVANMRETRRLYGALLVSILAAIAILVAVWPVINGYFK